MLERPENIVLPQKVFVPKDGASRDPGEGFVMKEQGWHRTLCLGRFLGEPCTWRFLPRHTQVREEGVRAEGITGRS